MSPKGQLCRLRSRSFGDSRRGRDPGAVRCSGDDRQPDARAADGRELSGQTRSPTPAARTSSTTSAAAHPAPMLNAGGGGYEMSNGGHLMIIKSASQRLHRACSSIRTAAIKPAANVIRGRAPAKGCGRPRRSTPRCRRGRRSASRPSRSTPTSSTSAARRAGRGSTPDAAPRWAPTSTTPAGRAAQRGGHRDHRLRRQAGAVGRRRDLERAVHDDPAGRRRAVRRVAEGHATTSTRPRR